MAELVADVVGFNGELTFDATKPDGTPRKLLDVARLKTLGWRRKAILKDGIRKVYEHHFQAKNAL